MQKKRGEPLYHALQTVLGTSCISDSFPVTSTIPVLRLSKHLNVFVLAQPLTFQHDVLSTHPLEPRSSFNKMLWVTTNFVGFREAKDRVVLDGRKFGNQEILIAA